MTFSLSRSSNYGQTIGQVNPMVPCHCLTLNICLCLLCLAYSPFLVYSLHRQSQPPPPSHPPGRRPNENGLHARQPGHQRRCPVISSGPWLWDKETCRALPMSPCRGLSNEEEVIPLCSDSQSSPISGTAVTPWQHMRTFERYSWKRLFIYLYIWGGLKIKSRLLRASYYYFLHSITNLLFTLTHLSRLGTA